MLAVHTICVGYGEQTIIDNMTFSLDSGQLLSIIGPSGTGKSTLLKVIAGLLKPWSGSVSIDGQVVDHLSAAERPVVYISQEPALFPHMSVAENLAFALSLRGDSKAIQQKIVNQLIEQLDLFGLSDRQPHQLSGGQKQRVAIGRALAINPKVLLMDEPFSSLDSQLRANLGGLIQRICRHYQLAVVLVTHDAKEALALSDYVLLLRDGQTKQLGTPRDIYYRPADADVAAMTGPWPQHAGSYYRPEDVMLTADRTGDLIINAQRSGHYVSYTLKQHDHVYTVTSHDIIAHAIGERVTLVWRQAEHI